MIHAVGSPDNTRSHFDVANYRPDNGADYPKGPLGRALQQVSPTDQIRSGVSVAFAKVGGWDHHVSEGGVRRRVVGNLKQFSDALAAFYRDMGDPIERVVVLTMTEFGCTAREDRNRGTDHGHGHAMFVMGGPVRGVVYREWLVSGSSSFTKVAT